MNAAAALSISYPTNAYPLSQAPILDLLKTHIYPSEIDSVIKKYLNTLSHSQRCQSLTKPNAHLVSEFSEWVEVEFAYLRRQGDVGCRSRLSCASSSCENERPEADGVLPFNNNALAVPSGTASTMEPGHLDFERSELQSRLSNSSLFSGLFSTEAEESELEERETEETEEPDERCAPEHYREVAESLLSSVRPVPEFEPLRTGSAPSKLFTIPEESEEDLVSLVDSNDEEMTPTKLSRPSSHSFPGKYDVSDNEGEEEDTRETRTVGSLYLRKGAYKF